MGQWLKMTFANFLCCNMCSLHFAMGQCQTLFFLFVFFVFHQWNWGRGRKNMAPLFPREFPCTLTCLLECFYGNHRWDDGLNVQNLRTTQMYRNENSFPKSTLKPASRDEELAPPSTAHPYQNSPRYVTTSCACWNGMSNSFLQCNGFRTFSELWPLSQYTRENK